MLNSCHDISAMVSAVDETVGAIYAALEETGMLDNTLIAFSSDVSYCYEPYNQGKYLYHVTL